MNFIPLPEAPAYMPCPTCGKNMVSDDPGQWCPCAPRDGNKLCIATNPHEAPTERETFEAEWANMPEWTPDCEPHRQWVKKLVWDFWQARAALEQAKEVRP